MSSPPTVSSLSGLPSPVNSPRSRSEYSTQNIAHTSGRNGGKARNVITTKNVLRLDPSPISAPRPNSRPIPGHGARRHASSSTSSHDHRLDTSGTSRGGRNSYSSIPVPIYTSQRRPSSPSSPSCNEALTFQALRTRPPLPQVADHPLLSRLSPSPSPTKGSASLPPSPAPHVPRTRKRIHHNYAFLEPSTSVASSYTSPAPSSRWSLPHPDSAQTSSPSPRWPKSKARSHRCVESFASLFSCHYGPAPAGFPFLCLLSNSIHILCLPIFLAKASRSLRIGCMHLRFLTLK